MHHQDGAEQKGSACSSLGQNFVKHWMQDLQLLQLTGAYCGLQDGLSSGASVRVSRRNLTISSFGPTCWRKTPLLMLGREQWFARPQIHFGMVMAGVKVWQTSCSQKEADKAKQKEKSFQKTFIWETRQHYSKMTSSLFACNPQG